MSVVAKNLDTGERRVVTAEAKLGRTGIALAGGSAGFRQPPEEEGRFEFFRVLDDDGRLLFEDRFEGKLDSAWEMPGGSRVEPDGLHATDCQPMRVKDLKLPATFTIESRFDDRALRGGAGVRRAGGRRLPVLAVQCREEGDPAPHQARWLPDTGKRAVPV